MPLATLSDGDREAVRRCLLAAARGDLFPEGEFHALFGMTRGSLLEVAQGWPPDDSPGRPGELAINNCLLNLLGYPHGRTAELRRLVGVPEPLLRRIFDAWRDAGDLPARVRVARKAVRVTCSVESLSSSSPLEAADALMRNHALRPLGSAWREVAYDLALAICAHVLLEDLAYGYPCMSVAHASTLARELLAATPEPRRFFTNAWWGESRSDFPHRDVVWSFTNASNSTFDVGVVCIGADAGAILWVEDED